MQDAAAEAAYVPACAHSGPCQIGAGLPAHCRASRLFVCVPAPSARMCMCHAAQALCKVPLVAEWPPGDSFTHKDALAAAPLLAPPCVQSFAALRLTQVCACMCVCVRVHAFAWVWGVHVRACVRVHERARGGGSASTCQGRPASLRVAPAAVCLWACVSHDPVVGPQALIP